ncbi:MAG TPA: hypothetical protein VGU43_06080, partial [Thermoplasmata archaeon]|nr:hypothetical protein [Thermoplasmata archaeon]
MPRAPPEPHLFIVFGATGDLMQRKLVGSLYTLARSLPKRSGSLRVLGCARQAMTDAEFRTLCLGSLTEAKAGTASELRSWTEKTLEYCSLGDGGPEGYRALRARIEEIERSEKLPGNRVFYLALPSEALGPTIAQ